nr:retrovirus-related Pol polyprotein from transposon TNT 1-94 [Tanacetum cinerariifolium]
FETYVKLKDLDLWHVIIEGDFLPIQNNLKPPRDKNQRSFIRGFWSGSSEKDDEKAKDETCLIAQASSEICLGIDLKPNEWIKDSGCSKHITGNRKLFFTYKAYNGEHAYNLGFNLLSVSQMCDIKCQVLFSEHGSEIVKKRKVISRGARKSGLYVMKLRNKLKDKIYLIAIEENSTLWHRRLGHANMHLIQSLVSKELVRNLPKIKFDPYFCDACKIGKQAHASHKAKNMVSTTRCLELIHMDLFGPSALQSYKGSLYTLVIIDDYSRIKRYIDTKPNHELIHYCLENPPYELGWKDKEVLTSEGSLVKGTERVNETYKNVLQDIRDQLNAEVETVQIILIGIDNDIYSTVDACPNA